MAIMAIMAQDSKTYLGSPFQDWYVLHLSNFIGETCFTLKLPRINPLRNCFWSSKFRITPTGAPACPHFVLSCQRFLKNSIYMEDMEAEHLIYNVYMYVYIYYIYTHIHKHVYIYTVIHMLYYSAICYTRQVIIQYYMAMSWITGILVGFPSVISGPWSGHSPALHSGLPRCQ